MVSTDKDIEDDSTEKKPAVGKVNFFGIEVDTATLATVGTILGLVGAGGTVWTLWNQNKPQTQPQQQQQQLPDPIAQKQYNEYVQAEMLRRQQMQKQVPKKAENNDLQTIHLEATQPSTQAVDYGRILDRDKQPPVTTFYPFNNSSYTPPVVSEQQDNGSTMLDMSIYDKKKPERHEDDEDVEQEQDQQEPSIDELYKKANNGYSY